MHRSTSAQRKDRWTLRRLGVRARRGYGVYGGAPMWRARDVALERALAFACKNGSLSRFSKSIFSTF
jgi:hypothetical protein